MTTSCNAHAWQSVSLLPLLLATIVLLRDSVHAFSPNHVFATTPNSPYGVSTSRPSLQPNTWRRPQSVGRMRKQSLGVPYHQQDNLLVCSVIRPGNPVYEMTGGANSTAAVGRVFFDANADVNVNVNNNNKDAGNNTSVSRLFVSKNQFKELLLQWSSLASLLCVVDCTLLPIVTLVLPLLGMAAATPTQMQWLCAVGHTFANYFVMPVGGLAISVNFATNRQSVRQRWITLVGSCGLLCVFLANGDCHAATPSLLHNIVFKPLEGVVGQEAVHDALHALHHGVVHRVVNLLGCAMLLSSNYASRRLRGVVQADGSSILQCADPFCIRDHTTTNGRRLRDGATRR